MNLLLNTSIPVEAKRFIAAGSVWRIGNGKDIQILDQPWLNNEVDPFVETRSPALINQNVHALFRMDRKEWDLEVIDDIFSERDKQLILQTVIEQELESDVISWKLEASGNYTVKSAYRLIQQQKGAWSGLTNDGLFKMLWNVKAPPKALHLVWRAATSCLPTKMQLQRRHVNVDNLCPVCNEAVESNIHIFVSCRVATTCWQIFNSNLSAGIFTEFTEWLHHNLSNQSQTGRAKIITLCWAIWRARNDLVWNGKRWKAMKIVAKSWEYLSQWKFAQSRVGGASLYPSSQGDGAVIWAKPRHNEVKITTDAAIFEEQGRSGVEMVAREFTGNLILAKTSCYSEVMNPVLAEAIAVKEALSWAEDMKWSNIVLESDCLVVVQMIRSKTPLRSRVGKIVNECREMIGRGNNVKLYFIKRSANMSAHELARVSHMYPDRSFDWSSVPIKVRDCILNDLIE